MTVSKRLRYEVLRRDNHACRYCGGAAPDVVLTVDHVVPTALGGTDDPGNLVTACRDCNSGKSATPADAALIADVDQDAIRWARAMQRATENALAERSAQIEVEKAVWGALESLADYLPGNWTDSIEQFLRAGLDKVEIVDSAYSALGTARIPARDVWRYFCGICWKKVGRRQEAARALLDAEQEASAPAPEPCAGDHPEVTGEVRYAAGIYYSLAAVCDTPREIA